MSSSVTHLAPHLPQIAGLAVLFTLAIAVFQLFNNPTNKIPGPWHTKFTGWAKSYYDTQGLGPQWVQRLHSHYGNTVRIAPNTVSVRDPSDVQQVHSFHNGFTKTHFYERAIPGSVSVFNTLDLDQHRRWRKLLSGSISESGLKSLVPQVEHKVDLAMRRMSDEMHRRGAVDVSAWVTRMATDVIGELSFGESFETLELVDSAGANGKGSGDTQYLKDLRAAAQNGGIRSVFCFLSGLNPNLIPVRAIREAFAVLGRLDVYSKQLIQKQRQMIELDPTFKSLFSKFMRARDEEGSMAEQEVADNARAYVIAGTDTTANTLTYLIWELCRPGHHGMRDRLVAELPDELTDESLKKCDYLNLVITEALRLHSAVPGYLPRYVPAKGATFAATGGDDEKGQDGYYLPGGVTVGTYNYSLHRNPQVFPSPEEFQPERWTSPTKAMKDAYLPFGGGSRVCIGLHLANIELRMMTAKFFKQFPKSEVSTLEGFSDADMVPLMFLLMVPRGHRCLIKAQA